MGLDNNWPRAPDDAPLIFETMVFGEEENGDRWLYSTRAEAEAGHHAAVRTVGERLLIKNGEPDAT